MPRPADRHLLVVHDLRTGPAAAEVAGLAFGTALGVAQLSGRLAAKAAEVTAPVVGFVLRPPLVPRRLQPGYAVQLLADWLQRERSEAEHALSRWSATAVPSAVDATLTHIDLERLATIMLDHVDLDAVMSDVVSRLDIKAIIAPILEQLDLTAIVVDQVDLGDVVSAALQRVDLTAIVVDQVDLGTVVSAALQRIDLTAIVVDQVDLGNVVYAALQRLDLTQIVLKQVDLIDVAEYVVDGIDLPEIIRESTGSVASEAVRGLRLQGVEADLAVGRVVDRILHPRRLRGTEEGPAPLASPESRVTPDTASDPPPKQPA